MGGVWGVACVTAGSAFIECKGAEDLCQQTGISTAILNNQNLRARFCFEASTVQEFHISPTKLLLPETNVQILVNANHEVVVL